MITDVIDPVESSTICNTTSQQRPVAQCYRPILKGSCNKLDKAKKEADSGANRVQTLWKLQSCKIQKLFLYHNAQTGLVQHGGAKMAAEWQRRRAIFKPLSCDWLTDREHKKQAKKNQSSSINSCFSSTHFYSVLKAH